MAAAKPRFDFRLETLDRFHQYAVGRMRQVLACLPVWSDAPPRHRARARWAILRTLKIRRVAWLYGASIRPSVPPES